MPKYGGHDDDVDEDDYCFCVGHDSEDEKGDGQHKMIVVALIIIVAAGDS